MKITTTLTAIATLFFLSLTAHAATPLTPADIQSGNFQLPGKPPVQTVNRRATDPWGVWAVVTLTDGTTHFVRQWNDGFINTWQTPNANQIWTRVNNTGTVYTADLSQVTTTYVTKYNDPAAPVPTGATHAYTITYTDPVTGVSRTEYYSRVTNATTGRKTTVLTGRIYTDKTGATIGNYTRIDAAGNIGTWRTTSQAGAVPVNTYLPQSTLDALKASGVTIAPNATATMTLSGSRIPVTLADGTRTFLYTNGSSTYFEQTAKTPYTYIDPTTGATIATQEIRWTNGTRLATTTAITNGIPTQITSQSTRWDPVNHRTLNNGTQRIDLTTGSLTTIQANGTQTTQANIFNGATPIGISQAGNGLHGTGGQSILMSDGSIITTTARGAMVLNKPVSGTATFTLYDNQTNTRTTGTATFNAAGQIQTLTWTDPATGTKWTTTYDAAGNPVSMTSTPVAGAPTIYAWNGTTFTQNGNPVSLNALPAFAAASAGASTAARASFFSSPLTTLAQANQPFSAAFLALNSWVEGTLGKLIAMIGFAIGGVMAAAGSRMAVAPFTVGLLMAFGPSVIRAIFG